MQEKQVKTWNDISLSFVWLLLEVIIFFITRNNAVVCFLMVVMCFPAWMFLSSYICFKLPFLHWSTFSLYFTEELPRYRFYHILKADEDGYILYKEAESFLIDIWRIDHNINKKVKEIWSEL